MHVLIIEDDRSVRKSIELILKSEGYTCDAAESGDSGLEAAREKTYDIIILDLTLPDVSGHLVLGALRSAKINTPVLVLSGRSARDEKIKTLGIGADDYVTKPFDKDELLARAQAIVRRAKGKTRLLKSAALDGALLARHGSASPWSFAESYTPTAAFDERRGANLRQDAAPAPDAQGSARASQHANLASLHTAVTRMPQDPDTIKAQRPRGAAVLSGTGGRVIVLGTSKGGTGKSTTAMHLIVALVTEHNKVGSVDLDAPQGTLTRYIENRHNFAAKKGIELAMPEHHMLASGSDSLAEFDEVLERLTGSCDYVVIDTPGHDSVLSRHAHTFADTLITPINDSFLDLDVLALVEAETLSIQGLNHYGNMVFEARKRKAQLGGRPIEWIVLRNRLSTLDARNKRHMADVLDTLSERLDFRGGLGLSERVVYRELFLQGLTLLDLFEPGTEVEMTMGHVAALQELRTLLDVVRPKPAGPEAPPVPKPRRKRSGTNGATAAETDGARPAPAVPMRSGSRA